MSLYVLRKDGRSSQNRGCYCDDIDGVLLAWEVESEAADYAEAYPRPGGRSWIVERLNTDVIDRYKHNRPAGFPVYRLVNQQGALIDMDTSPVSNRSKRSSRAMLVEVFEDMDNRRFAICSKAETEKEFYAEAAEAIAGPDNREWVLRLRELLPLVADLVCKYRGYKAETVQEKRELVAGDLEMPRD